MGTLLGKNLIMLDISVSFQDGVIEYSAKFEYGWKDIQGDFKWLIFLPLVGNTVKSNKTEYLRIVSK